MSCGVLQFFRSTHREAMCTRFGHASLGGVVVIAATQESVNVAKKNFSISAAYSTSAPININRFNN